MYQVDILENLDWKPVACNIEDRNVLYKTLENNLGQSHRVLKDDKLLAFLDGSLYQYHWFMNTQNHLETSLSRYYPEENAKTYQKKRGK